MKTFLLVLGALTMPAQAFGQAGQATTGPVTWAELEGAVIEADILSDRLSERDGRQIPSQAHRRWKIVISAGDWIEVTTSATHRFARGEVKEEPTSGAAILDQPTNAHAGGPGDQMWHFEQETLAYTRNFEQSATAYRLKFVFSRGSDRLNCQVSHSWARENGTTGPMKMTSTADGLPVTMISDRQRSANCRVSKGNAVTPTNAVTPNHR
jgi:hypothetical protein